MSIESRGGIEAQSVVQRIYGQLGHKIGWANATSDTSKVEDVELLSTTGYDADFLVEHHRVSGLLEANEKFGGGALSIADIYKGVKNFDEIEIDADIPGLGEKRKADLRQLAQFIKICEVNKLMGRYKLDDEELAKKFFSGEDIIIKTKKGDVNLNKGCPFDSLRDFDYDEYLKKIQENQIGFQYIGTIRDQALDKHHIENAGHAQFFSTGEVKPDGRERLLWLPVSPAMAASEARTDLPKKGLRFRSENHVHEVGSFNEDTAMTVKFDRALLSLHRRGITASKDHEGTNRRMYNAAIGVGPKEDAMTYKENFINPNTNKEEELDVVDIGSNRKGLIYKGLHKTYDKAMNDARGYALEQDEADDIILTDIIATYILSNTNDWLMSLSKAAGDKFGYTALIASQGRSWSDFKFCLKIRCRSVDPEDADKFVVKPQIFRDIRQLLDYLKRRAALFKDVGIPGEFKPAGGSAESVEDEDEAPEELVKTLTPEMLANCSELFQEIFKGKAAEAAEEFANKDLGAAIATDSGRKSIKEYMEESLRGMADGQLVLKLTGGVSGQTGIDRIFEFLKTLSPEAKKQLWDNLKSSQPAAPSPQKRKKQ